MKHDTLRAPRVWPAVVACATGGLSLVLGVIVIVGWHLRSVTLVQVVPTFAPMQFNTALGFVLCGVGLIAVGIDRRRVAGAVGVLASAIGLLTLLEYLADVNIGLDELFMDHFTSVETSHPGRMAPPTAVCFTLCGLMCVIASRPALRVSRALLLALLGSCVLALGGASLFGYATGNVRAYGWGEATHMAMHTSVGFVALGMGFLSYLHRFIQSGDGFSMKHTLTLALLTSLVFVLDLSLEQGIAAGALYLIPLVVSLGSPHERDTYTVAVAASALTVIGYFESQPTGIEMAALVANRGIAIGAIWIATVLALKRRASDRRFGAIVNSAPDAMVLVDREGVIRHVNEQGFAMFGYEREELVGQRVEVLVPDALREAHLKHRRRYVEAPVARKMGDDAVLLVRRKDGTELPVDISLSPVDWGESFAVVVAIRDVAARVRAEEEARSANAALSRSNEQLTRTNTSLAQSNEELDRFAYVASHDLKAPLRAIDNLSTWIADDLRDAMSAETREQMELLRNRVKRMERLLDDLLEYSRVGRVEGHIESVDTRELVDGLRMLYEIPATLTVNVADDLPTLDTLRSPLEQVLRNLLDNAIKHRDHDSGRVDITVRDLGECFEFSVSDDGPGIEPRFHEKIFEVFQTLRRRDDVDSSGMGLALVRKIVLTYGGKIELDSDTGRGADFRFTWPKQIERDRKEKL